MKKILFAMAVLAALASCQKADLAEQNSVNTNGERVITAYFDNAGTKTTLDDNGVTPKWTGTETIMILNGSTFDEITSDEIVFSDDGKSITFTTTLSGPLYAVYPSTATSADKIETENIVPVTLSAENQDGTFASANICVAKENDGSLAFKNVTSVLHLTQTASTGVNEIIITTPSAYIAGTGTVDMSAATPALTFNSPQSKKIKVKSESVKTHYYIAVAPTTLPAGTAFGFATGSELGGTNLSEEKTIAANTIYNIGSMDESELGSNKYHEYVEIGGLKWATMNVGATSATDNGYYFAWGYTDGCKRNSSNNRWVLASDNTTEKQFNTTYFENRDDSSFKDAATANWGGSWRMPDKSEFDQLKNAVYWTWQENTGSYVFKPDATHSGGGKSNSIPEGWAESDALLFFPAAGFGDGNSLNNPKETCDFWSRTTASQSAKSNALCITVQYGSGLAFGVGGNDKCYGFSVRPVSD